MARLTSIILALATAATVVQAQNTQLIPTTLPACAQSCALLQQAATSCLANPAAAQSCFCQSAILAQVKTAPQTNICQGFCDDASWGQIASWYQSTCANGGTNAGVSAAATTMATQTRPADTDGTGGAQAIGAASGPAGTSAPAATNGAGTQAASGTTSNSNGAANYTNGQQWWQTHYQYVIMLIVLLVAFCALGFGGAFWYRRHQRNKARNPAAYAGGNAAQWGPNNSTHDFNAQNERQARGALAQQPGSLGGAAMVERANSRKGGKGKAISGILRKGRS